MNYKLILAIALRLPPANYELKVGESQLRIMDA